MTYSIADLDFRTNSLGILNLAVQMVHFLAEREEIGQLNVLSNASLSDRLKLPPQVRVKLHNHASAKSLGRILWEQWGVYQQAARWKSDWLFLPKGFASFMRRCPVKLATCVADTSYDYYRRTYPNRVPTFIQKYYDASVRGTIRNSRVIFTISDFSGTEVLRVAKEQRLKAPPVRTIGIGFLPQKNAYEKKDRVMVLASDLPHKRTDLAIEYLTEWQKRTNFGGTVEWVGRFAQGAKLPEFPNWITHARLPDAEFKRLKGEARALVYVSEYEGFGMPPVEATIAGTCPVYSSLPATREVMGKAGFPFENSSYQSFEEAMRQALHVSREQLDAWGQELLQRHSWPCVADRVVRGLIEHQ